MIISFDADVDEIVGDERGEKKASSSLTKLRDDVYFVSGASTIIYFLFP